VAGSETGMTYDPLVIEISVTVADAGNGELTVTPTYPEDIVFKNLYEVSGAWTPEVTKILTGRELVEGEFEFELVDAADVVLQTVTNLADGTVPFLPLVFDQEDIGQTFEFTIREKSGANIDYTYDTSIYRLIVTVANAEGGGLEITTATYKDDETEITPDITFTNIYTEPTPVTHDPPVEKLVIGNGAPQDAQFSFQMKAVTPDAPMPEGAVDGLMTHTITGAGSFGFGVMEFTEVGTYVYELRELETENKNFAFDPTIYTITITITQEGHNLVKDVIYTKNNSTEASTEAIVFTNTWQTIQIKGTKTWIGGPAVKPVIWFKLQRSLPGGMPEDVPGAPILKLDNVTEVTWTDLAKFAEGGETYIFSVREVDQTGQILNLADYTKTENGLNVTNTAKSVLPKTGEAAPLPFTGLMLLLGAGLITILRRKRSKI
jgi:pilin isopeptide linkage protein/LPXTG-motif cell wall-anchored protein